MADRVNFTAGRLAEFRCSPGKPQSFLWDSKAPGLALRVTKHGSRAYVFQGRLKDGQTIRLTIGEPIGENGHGVHTIPKAQEEARRLQRLIDEGRDPRLERAATVAAARATRTAEKAERSKREVTGLMAWTAYCTDRRARWSERNQADHLAFATQGGVKRKRGAGNTLPGPLHSLLARPLTEIDAAAVQAWVKREAPARPSRAQLGFRLLRAFINWCAEHDEYRGIAQLDACKGKKTRESLGKPVAKSDSLQREQLAPWFAAVRGDTNPVFSAYLQSLLLTGARREELASLLWEDVDFQWKSMRIRDKVEGERVIPLTPCVAYLLDGLPRRTGNPYVFTSATAASGRIQEPRVTHNRALELAGVPHVSLHGLRRSFGSLAEWVEVPIGVVAQIQGHKPSAIAEKHYRVRPLDLLRMWHERIEAWMLQQAGIKFHTQDAVTGNMPVSDQPDR